MKKEWLKGHFAIVERYLTLENVLLFYGVAAGLLFTYALSLLAKDSFGSFGALQEQIAVLLEHGVAVGLIGLGGGLFLDLLKKEKKKEEG